jgi:hypothetical protein
MAVVALGLNLVLGRAFGPRGIADAIVIREAGMLAGFWILMSRKPSQARQSGSPVSSLSDVRVSEKPNLSSSLA